MSRDFVDPSHATKTTGYLLTNIGHTSSKAAALAIECGDFQTAIEWINQGRSIVWDQLSQLRFPLEGLERVNVKLAEKLRATAKELAVSSTQTQFQDVSVLSSGTERVRDMALANEGQKHRKLAVDWETGIAQAQSLPGFDKFLLPKEYDYLSKAASDAIVVIINADWKRCDALVIISGFDEGRDPLHVPLQGLSLNDAELMHTNLMFIIDEGFDFRSESERLKLSTKNALNPLESSGHSEGLVAFKEILSDLWYKIVFPIINALITQGVLSKNVSASIGYPFCTELIMSKPLSSDTLRHVRWCPTGRLSFLPLHAAGDYSKSEPGNRVFDFIISSYIPTLNSVIYDAPKEQKKPKILVVACSSPTPQSLCIPGTKDEVIHIRKHALSSSLDFTALEEDSATSISVLEDMKKASWTHFACHGVQNPITPTASSLLLANGSELKLSDIAAVDLPHAELAFLSACQTAAGYDKVPSESVHLAAGMLLAGYRSVIATMWSIGDRHAPQVADDVYRHLLRKDSPDYKESALALHLAVGELRKRVGETSFIAWVPYIHLGA